MSVTPGAFVPARRRADRRRLIVRRWVTAAIVVGVAVAGGIAAVPLFQRAIRAFTLPLQYAMIIREQAAQKGLDPALIAAVIDSETGFDARTSPTGAEGLMQIEPATATFLARKSGGTTFSVADLARPAINIAYGSYYLRYLLNEYGGDETAALAAYNGGETNVDRWITVAHDAGHRFGVADIPFPQTRAYVQKVEQRQAAYRANYPQQLGY
jgi:soluble lytic murein transglycosylase